MARQDIEMQKELEPKRMDYARRKILELGFAIEQETKTAIRFRFKGELVTIFPYSGWHTGKSIVDGRGINNLLLQLTK